MGQIDFDGSNSTVKADIIRGQTGTTVKLGGLLDTDGNYIQTEKGGDLTSASPLVIDTDGDYFDVTGTTNFAAMTVAADRQFTLQFDGVLTMTHHATNLDLPGEANITTAAGDVATFQSTGSNTVQCINYTKADGTGIVGGGGNKTILIQPLADSDGKDTSIGNQTRAINMVDGSSVWGYGAWYVPDDFTSFTSAKFIIKSLGTGNMRASFAAGATAAGEDVDADEDSIAATEYAVTANQTSFIDVTAAFNGLTFGANHIINFASNRAGNHGNDTVSAAMYYLGMVLVYA
jgi:hypothetical protein